MMIQVHFALFVSCLCVSGFLLDSSTTNSHNSFPRIFTTDNCSDSGKIDCSATDSYIPVCADIHHAKWICREYCNLCNLTDGNWTEWSEWSNCGVTCGNGYVTRTRTCSNPAPANGGLDCTEHNAERNPCSLGPCPVRGGWSSWGSWGTCSVTCGIGMERRDRTCSNPPPQFFGDHCFGDSNDVRICTPRQCAVRGGWSSWGSWGTCSVTCGIGMQRRDRTCSNPPPQFFGDHCFGDSEDVRICTLRHCADGGWSSWSAWGQCSLAYGMFGMHRRERLCNNPTPSLLGATCRGPYTEWGVCWQTGPDGSCCLEYAVHGSNDHLTKIRLCDGSGHGSCSPNRGRFEIFYNNTWGTVCDDYWDTNASNVFCRSIGFYTGAMGTQSTIVNASRPIHLDDVRCSGNEPSIFQCRHNPLGHHDCSHGEDIYVSCN